MSSGRGLKIRENARARLLWPFRFLSLAGLYNYYIQQQQQKQRRLYCARVCKDYYGERLIGVNRAGCCVRSFPSDTGPTLFLSQANTLFPKSFVFECARDAKGMINGKRAS
jgi:hypothetical protein